MKEIKVKFTYRNKLRDCYDVLHQSAYLIDNETIFLLGNSECPALVINHTKENGLKFKELDIDTFNLIIDHKIMNKFLEFYKFGPDYDFLYPKLDCSNIFVTNDDKRGFEMILRNDEEVDLEYWDKDFDFFEKSLGEGKN